MANVYRDGIVHTVQTNISLPMFLKMHFLKCTVLWNSGQKKRKFVQTVFFFRNVQFLEERKTLQTLNNHFYIEANNLDLELKIFEDFATVCCRVDSSSVLSQALKKSCFTAQV